MFKCYFIFYPPLENLPIDGLIFILNMDFIPVIGMEIELPVYNGDGGEPNEVFVITNIQYKPFPESRFWVDIESTSHWNGEHWYQETLPDMHKVGWQNIDDSLR